MLPGHYEPGAVIDAALKIYVDGVERPHVSASWEGNTTGGLPESLVAAGDGIYSRTGSITWAPQSAVTRHPLAPIGDSRWMPTQGAHVRIVAVVNGVEFPRFWGFLGASTYQLRSDTVTTQITDGLQGGLQEPVTISPTLAAGMYLRSGWVAWRSVEQAGYGILPPVTEDTVLHNGHQFGMLAAVGKTTGTGIGYGDNGYISAANQTTAAVPVERGGRDIMIYARAGNEREDASWRAQMTDGSTVSMTWSTSNRTVSLWTSRDGRVFEKEIVKIHDGSPLLCAKIGSGGIRVWTDPEHSEWHRSAGVPSTVKVAIMTAGRTAGIKVDYVSRDEDAAERVSMMRRPLPLLQLSALEQVRILATRGCENVTCESVISEWAAATLSTVWVDEEGRLNIAARDRLAAGKAEILDKVSEKVFGGAWKTARDGVRSGVLIEGVAPNFRGGNEWAGTVAFQPDNIQELDPNKDVEIFHSWPDEVDVHGLDTNMRPLVNSKKKIFAWAEFNKGVGSWWSTVFENQEEPEGYRWTGDAANHEDLSAKLERLGQRTVKMTFRVQKKTNKGPEKYYLATPSIAVGDLRFGNRGIPMPILRCQTLVTWTKFQRRHKSSSPTGSVYRLDSDWWLHPEDASRVARALAAEIGVERVTFDALDMLWDPRKQVGDSVTLQSTDSSGAAVWEVECLVTGYRESWAGKVPSVTLNLDVKKMTDLRGGKTYRDMAAAYEVYEDVPDTATYNGIYSRLPERI